MQVGSNHVTTHACVPQFPCLESDAVTPERHLAQSLSHSRGPQSLWLSVPQHYSEPGTEVALKGMLTQ